MERAERAALRDACGGFGVILRGVCFPCRRIVKAALGYAGRPRTRDFSFGGKRPVSYQQYKHEHGMPMDGIVKMLGHANTTVTEKHYVKFRDAAMSNAKIPYSIRLSRHFPPQENLTDLLTKVHFSSESLPIMQKRGAIPAIFHQTQQKGRHF